MNKLINNKLNNIKIFKSSITIIKHSKLGQTRKNKKREI